MLVDKNIKKIYMGGNKILAVMHKGEIIWGHIEEKVKVRIEIYYMECAIEIEGKEYISKRKRPLKLKLSSSKTEFTFIVKADKNSKYDIFFPRKPFVKNEQGSPEGKEYTVTLDNLKTNNIRIMPS